MRSAQASVVEIEKGKRYRIFIEDGYGADGKRKRVSKTVRGTRKEAEQVKNRMLVERGRVAADRLTLNSFFDAFFLPSAEDRLRPSTVQGYRSHYKSYLRNSIGELELAAITPMTVNRWLAGIQGEAARYEAFRALKMILAKAVRWEMLPANPCASVDPPKRKQYKPEVLTRAEALLYIEHFRGTPIEAAVLIAIGCGLRRSEIVALNWSDIQDGTVLVDNAITVVDGKVVDAPPKTRFSTRRVFIPSSIDKALKRLKTAADAPLLTDADGQRMLPNTLTALYRKHLAKLPPEVKRVSLKNLRHTSLTLALESGADILAVSRRAGHATVNITASYYLRPSDELDASTAAKMDAFFDQLAQVGTPARDRADG